MSTLSALRSAAVSSLLLLLTLTQGSPVGAQDLTGTIGGTVRAATDAVLAGASITVRNQAIKLQRVVTSGEDGTYVVTDLPVQGSYDVQVEFSGFAPVVQSGISLIANSRVVVDISMPAVTEETLVVTGRVAGIENTRSTVQQTISDALVHSLPLIGREFITLTSLTAGFTGNPYYPSALGQQYWGNNVVVDGGSHYSKWRGAARTFYSGYPLNAIKEVEVLTSQFSAEHGESLGSVTTAVTNSGTNEVHGSALFFLQHGALNDIPMFAVANPPFGQQRFGLTYGGPIAKDRTHLFTSYEGKRQRGHNIVVSPLAGIGALTDSNEDEHLFFAKVDHKPRQRDLFTARYNGQRFRWHDEPGGLFLPGVGTAVRDDVHTVLVSDTTLFSSTTLNQVRVQFARYTNQQTDLQRSLYVSRAGFSVQGGVLGPYGFGTTPEDTWEANDTLAYKRGAHALKMGAGVKWVKANTRSLQYGFGAYLFAGDPTTALLPSQFVQTFARTDAAATADPASLSTALFLQDDWRVHERLTLNLGLRYDLESLRNLGVSVAADRNNLQPRLGIAWQPTNGRLIVRGGAGVYNQQHLLYYASRVRIEGADGVAMLRVNQGSPLMPVFPNVLSASAIGLLPRDIQQLAPEFRNPYSVQVTAGAERPLFGMTVGADVVYLRGRDLMSLVDINAPASNVKPNVRTVAEADATRPIAPAPGGFRKIVELGNQGDSWYRALQLKASRSAGRLQTLASYTWSKAEDRANYLLPEDSRNLAAEKGRADNDLRHNLTFGFTWQVPAARPVLTGLSLSGVGTFRSGRPYTQFWGDDRNGTSQNDARPGGRNGLETDGFRTIDLALARQFRVHRTAIEGRIEAFNVLSTVNFNQYVGTLSIYYAQPVTAFPRRRIQAAAIVRF